MDHGRKIRGADGTWVREGRPRCFVCVLVDPCGAVGLKIAGWRTAVVSRNVCCRLDACGAAARCEDSRVFCSRYCSIIKDHIVLFLFTIGYLWCDARREARTAVGLSIENRVVGFFAGGISGAKRARLFFFLFVYFTWGSKRWARSNGLRKPHGTSTFTDIIYLFIVLGCSKKRGRTFDTAT